MKMPEKRVQWWRTGGAALALVMRFVPRRLRFPAAVQLAGVAVYVVRRTPQFRLLANAANERLNTPQETALHLLLHVMTTGHTAFDPDITIDGYDRFAAACGRGPGLLLVSPHAALGLAMLRTFHDDGLTPLVFGPDPNMRVPGTTVTLETVQRSPTSFVKMRTQLRRGRLVITMLDRAEHEAGTQEFDTARGPVIFAPALLHLAARCGASVAFCEAQLQGSSLRGRIVLASSVTAQGVEQEFIDFVRSAVARRAASADPPRMQPVQT